MLHSVAGQRQANVRRSVIPHAATIDTFDAPHIVCLWETPPGLVLQDANVDALPLVGGMKTTPEEFEIAKARMDAVADREHRSRLGADLVT